MNCRADYVVEKLWAAAAVVEETDRERNASDDEGDDAATAAGVMLPDDLPCIFQDIQELHKAQAPC